MPNAKAHLEYLKASSELDAEIVQHDSLARHKENVRRQESDLTCDLVEALSQFYKKHEVSFSLCDSSPMNHRTIEIKVDGYAYEISVSRIKDES